MAQVALQYSVGSKLHKQFPDELRVVGYEVISDVDGSETPYTADYTIGSNDGSIAFAVLSDATAGTMTVELYHGTTHATLVNTNALLQGGHNSSTPAAPAASLTLDLTTAEDRKALVLVNPGARVQSGQTISAWLGANNKVSLKLSADANYTANSTVVVVCLAGGKRHQPGPASA